MRARNVGLGMCVFAALTLGVVSAQPGGGNRTPQPRPTLVIPTRQSIDPAMEITLRALTLTPPQDAPVVQMPDLAATATAVSAQIPADFADIQATAAGLIEQVGEVSFDTDDLLAYLEGIAGLGSLTYDKETGLAHATLIISEELVNEMLIAALEAAEIEFTAAAADLYTSTVTLVVTGLTVGVLSDATVQIFASTAVMDGEIVFTLVNGSINGRPLTSSMLDQFIQARATVLDQIPAILVGGTVPVEYAVESLVITETEAYVTVVFDPTAQSQP